MVAGSVGCIALPTNEKASPVFGDRSMTHNMSKCVGLKEAHAAFSTAVKRNEFDWTVPHGFGKNTQRMDISAT